MALKEAFNEISTSKLRIFEWNKRSQIIFLIILNIILKFYMLFFDVYPSDVDFYSSTGYLLLSDILPYQSFSELNIHNLYVWLNTQHPNGPLNYLFYSAIIIFFGDSLFSIKFPWLISEIIIVVYLYRIVEKIYNKKKGMLAALFYSFCAPSYFTGILLGCDELIAGAFTIMALYYLIEDRKILSAFLLSLSISYKLYPLLFMPSLFLYFLNNYSFKQFLLYISTIVLTFIIISLPYLILAPKDFIEIILGQSNRLITISFGVYLEDTWFYKPLIYINFNIFSLINHYIPNSSSINSIAITLSITPHLLSEILIIGSIFLHDFRFIFIKKKKYNPIRLFKFISIYLMVIPLLSLSYNYRYFQWLIPPLIISVMAKFKIVPLRKEENKTRGRKIQEEYSTFTRTNIIMNFIFMSLIIIVNSYQLLTGNYFRVPFGILIYNNYLWSFFLIYTIYLFVNISLSMKNVLFKNLLWFSYFQGTAGLALYFSYEGRIYNHEGEFPFLFLFLTFYIISWLFFIIIYKRE